MKILTDTSFLITYIDDKRKHHTIAKKYAEYFTSSEKFVIYISSIVVFEFQRKQSIEDIFRVLPKINMAYDINHALSSAKLCKIYEERQGKFIKNDKSSRIKANNDWKLIGQAEYEKIDLIITEDEKSLSKYVRTLNDLGVMKTKVKLLKDGFQTENN